MSVYQFLWWTRRSDTIRKHSVNLPATSTAIPWYQVVRQPSLIFIFTDHIRKMREGNIFTLCVSPHLGGGEYPGQVQTGEVPPPPSRVRGTLHPGMLVPAIWTWTWDGSYAAVDMSLAFTQEDFLFMNFCLITGIKLKLSRTSEYDQ